MNKHARQIDRAQNLAIVLLSVSFVFLLIQTPLFSERGAEGLRESVRSWLSGETATAQEEDALSTLTVPLRIVYSNDFLRSGSDALTTADAAFESAGSFLGEAIGSSYGITSVPESVFLTALEGSGIYFEFLSPVALEVLSARLGVTPMTTRALDVRRCLLSQNYSENVQLYLQAQDGSCLCFSTAVSAASLADYLETQHGESVDFAFALGAEYSALSPYTLVFRENTPRSELAGANALSEYPTEDLLRAAEFNPHTRDRYTDSSGTEVVIESQRKLYLHADGLVVYSGGAMEGDSLFSLGEADAAQFSRLEVCSAARRLIGALSQGRIGDAQLYVSGMQTAEDGDVVLFDYMVGGTPIRFADGTHAAEVHVSGSSITFFSLRLRRYASSAQESLLLPLSLARAIAQRYPGCELSVAYIDSFGDTVRASWVADE